MKTRKMLAAELANLRAQINAQDMPSRRKLKDQLKQQTETITMLDKDNNSLRLENNNLRADRDALRAEITALRAPAPVEATPA